MDSKFTVLNLQSGVLIDNIYINYMRIMRIVRFIRKSVQFRHYPRKPKRDLVVKFDIFLSRNSIVEVPVYGVICVINRLRTNPELCFILDPNSRALQGYFLEKSYDPWCLSPWKTIWLIQYKLYWLKRFF